MSQPNPPYDPYGQQPGYGGQQQPPPPSDPYGPPQQPYGQPAYGPPQQPQYDQYGLPAGQQSPWEQQQPQYGQPEYGQPQFGQPQQTYGQPVTPPKSRKGLWIGLSAGAVALVLLCCGGAFAFYKWAEDKADEALEPVTRISGNPTPRTSGPPKQPTITLTLPGKVGSRARITDAQHAQFVKDTEAAMKKDAKVADTVVGYYGTPDPKKDKLYLAGATTTTPMGKAGFEATFKAMSKEAGLSDMTGVTDVNPGPLGGYAKCGLLKIEGMPVAACAWADEGSFVTVMWYNRQVTSQIKAELVTIRGQVEQKS